MQVDFDIKDMIWAIEHAELHDVQKLARLLRAAIMLPDENYIHVTPIEVVDPPDPGGPVRPQYFQGGFHWDGQQLSEEQPNT